MSDTVDEYVRRLGQLLAYEKALPGSEVPRKVPDPRDRRRRGKIQCGVGRYDPAQKNAFFYQHTGAGLNFVFDYRLEGAGTLAFPSYSLTFIHPGGTLILYHKDPDRRQWPVHPLRHIQITPGEPQGFWAETRLPCFLPEERTEDDPIRLVEFFDALAQRL